MKDEDKELLEAAEAGDLEGVKKALEKGAKIDAQSEFFSESALHIASSKGFLEIVEFLVDQGADILLLNGTDFTPIHLAARDGRIRVVEFLLSKVEKIPERLIWDMINVGQMSVDGDPRIVQMLENYSVKLAKPSTGSVEDAEASLLEGAHDGNLEQVITALEAGAEIEVVDNRGMTPIIWAALRGHLDVVKALLERGANINSTNWAGWTPLMQACAQLHEELAKFLVEQGADIHMKTKYSGTALIFAAGTGQYELTKYLLDKGADPFVEITGTDDEDGMTALSYARREGYDDVIKLLEKAMSK
jgi:ankyrin repeat protein